MSTTVSSTVSTRTRRAAVVPVANAEANTKANVKPKTADSTLELMSLISAGARDEVYSNLIGWLSKRRGCAGAGLFVPNQSTVSCVVNSFNGPVFENSELEAAIEEAAQVASATAKTEIKRPAKVRNIAIVAVPVVTNDREVGALVGAIVADPDAQPDDSFLLTAAAYASLWHANESKQEIRHDLSLTASTLDLVSTIEAADSFSEASIATVNSVRDHLKVRGVVLGLVKGTAQRCHVAAMSGLAEFDTRGALSKTIEDALDESVIRDRLSVVPSDESENRDSLLCHESLRHETQAVRIVSHPLKRNDGHVLGAWIVIEDRPSSKHTASTTLLRAAAPRVAAALALSQRADSALFSNKKRTQNWLQWFSRAAILSVVIAAIMLIPVPYQIQCECSAEPEVRRFVVAPNEGLIERTFVEPGEVVKQGQLLARMDGRDVRWELAGLVAEKQKAEKDHDSRLLEGDVAAAQRAILEFQRIEAREQVLTRQRDQLEVTSPIDGIILDGHLDRVENAPVTIGQALYEVAPIAPVTVEVAISHDEFANVRESDEVVIRFDGIDDDFTGTIERIHPRSEVRDGDNVFVAEVAIANTDAKLRPGMSGYARIKGQTHALGWNLFHKPWEHLRKSLPF